MDRNPEELHQMMFLRAGDDIAMHPFLKEAAEGKLDHRLWATYVSNRLGAGTDFVTYLEALAKAAKDQGYPQIQAAVESNLDEELGKHEGVTQTERTHEEWRRWFRSDMKTLLAGEDFETKIPEVLSYTRTLQALAKRGNVLEMTGALTGLELLIAREYEKILKGLETQFGTQISAEGYTYIRSHAFHDHRHFDELWAPLNAACKTRQDVENALSGLRQVTNAKTLFLDGIERYGRERRAVL